MKIKPLITVSICVFILGFGVGCANHYPDLPPASIQRSHVVNPYDYNYLIGPGDQLSIFVWRNTEVSSSVVVRPDGKITTPLVEDLIASGKTSTALAREIEQVLGTYIRDPIVTVMITGFQGPYSEQVRVIGEAARPQALAYRQGMTALDVMIAVGGLTSFAAGDRASVVRIIKGEQRQFALRLESLIKDGEIEANADILPGDIIIIPEAWF
ncbi:MAG TPA: sugar ABC transporter substrate-binding protein [Gammaproteobacteria bacterium]|nr:sugar ABC transporter substrate-binding protein [Gammaproteobacteria bacterium]